MNRGKKRLEIALTKGSSRASGSQAHDFKSVGSGRKLQKLAGGEDSVAQQSSPSRPLSPNVEIDPPKNSTQETSDKRFGT